MPIVLMSCIRSVISYGTVSDHLTIFHSFCSALEAVHNYDAMILRKASESFVELINAWNCNTNLLPYRWFFIWHQVLLIQVFSLPCCGARDMTRAVSRNLVSFIIIYDIQTLPNIVQPIEHLCTIHIAAEAACSKKYDIFKFSFELASNVILTVKLRRQFTPVSTVSHFQRIIPFS